MPMRRKTRSLLWLLRVALCWYPLSLGDYEPVPGMSIAESGQTESRGLRPTEVGGLVIIHPNLRISKGRLKICVFSRSCYDGGAVAIHSKALRGG